MVDPIDIAMTVAAVVLTAKGVSKFFSRKEDIQRHKEQLKKLDQLLKDKGLASE